MVIFRDFGIEYVNKGYKDENITGSINMSYLQVPVFAALKFPVSDNTKLAIKVGPYFSYGLFGSDILRFDGRNSSKTNVFDSGTGFDRLDVGAIAGVSVDFSNFTIGIEYSRGLKALSSGDKMYNQAFGLVVGYGF